MPVIRLSPTQRPADRPPSRRALLSLGAALAGLPWLGGIARAQRARPAEVPVAELMVPGPLGERTLGDPRAPVTLVEYASLTCGHCANFHANTFPVLKTRYIDTGRVYYVAREFPLDPLATAGFMLARCAGEGRYFAMLSVLFQQQRGWAFAERPVDALLGLARQAGFSQESFEACLRNETIYAGVLAVRQRGQERFQVDSTPTFFINGRRHVGALTVAQLEAIIEPLLKT